MSFNRYLGMGRLTRDPELRTTPGGVSVCEFGLAVDDGFGVVKQTCFIDVTVWKGQAEFVNKYFSKGDGIFVEGRLRFDQWEDKKTGAKRSKHRVIAERVAFPVGTSTKKAQSSTPPGISEEEWHKQQGLNEGQL